ncbi:hypothetical protein LINPERPRIM_LOCUS37824 [Linum perenne]
MEVGLEAVSTTEDFILHLETLPKQTSYKGEPI